MYVYAVGISAFWLAQVVDSTKDGENGPPPGPSMADLISLFAAIFLVFYFVVVRPQQKEQKKKKELLDSLQKNDRVVTSGGIIGTILRTSDTEVVLKVADKNDVRMKFLRSAILSKLKDEPVSREESKKEKTPANS